jgi:hypothetical protein
VGIFFEMLDILGFAVNASYAADGIRDDGVVGTLIGLGISGAFLTAAVLLIVNGHAPVWRQVLAVVVGCAGIFLAGLVLEARARMRRREAGR